MIYFIPYPPFSPSSILSVSRSPLRYSPADFGPEVDGSTSQNSPDQPATQVQIIFLLIGSRTQSPCPLHLPHLYRCECVQPYVNAAPANRLPGSVCRLEPRLVDVDECLLGLTNCSAAAICTDLPQGYSCKCQEGYTEGNPDEPGRVCGALLCGRCNGHGDCVQDPVSKNITCACVAGWSGEFCDVEQSNILIILMLILALLFLLLMLLCCLYFCLKTRCFRRRQSDSSMSQEILGSDLYHTIPRAKLKPYAGSFSSASSSSMEEIERRVITDVTRSEVRTTTVDGQASAQDHNAQFMVHGPGQDWSESSASGAIRRRGGTTGGYQRDYEDRDDSESEEEAGGGVYARTTHQSQHHDYEPSADGRGGLDRVRNEFVMTKTGNETNYY